MLRTLIRELFVEDDVEAVRLLANSSEPWGNRPAPESFLDLFPLEGDMVWAPATLKAWPMSALMSLNPVFRDDEDVGMVEWEILNWGRVPGTLQLGFFRWDTNPGEDEPEDEAIVTFAPGAWSSGALPVHHWTPPDPPPDPPETADDIRNVYARWFPAHLQEYAP